MKPKLIIWSDFVAPTGFGNVAKNLFSDMHQFFDVSIVAINYYGDKKYDTSKYFIYSAAKDDMLNKTNLFNVIKEEQPELIILFQDMVNIASVLPEIKRRSPQSKIVCYFPVDGPDISPAWYILFDQADVLITYTDWAIQVIKDTFPKLKKPLYKLYHGVDRTVFHPTSMKRIENFRAQLNWTNKFVICNVNRFQPRKAIPLSVRAFSLFAKGYKVCRCGNWYPIHKGFCDMNGCSASDVIETVNDVKTDVFYYLHMHAAEVSMGMDRTCTLQSFFVNNGFIDTDLKTLFAINDKIIYKGEVPEFVVNDIYNTANINLSTSNGEGFGLSLIESMATGTRSIAPRNSAIPEILKDTGTLVNNAAVYGHPHDSAIIRPVVDVKEVVKALNEEYKIWKILGVEKSVDLKCIETAEEYYDWDRIRQELKDIINTVIK